MNLMINSFSHINLIFFLLNLTCNRWYMTPQTVNAYYSPSRNQIGKFILLVSCPEKTQSYSIVYYYYYYIITNTIGLQSSHYLHYHHCHSQKHQYYQSSPVYLLAKREMGITTSEGYRGIPPAPQNCEQLK